MLIFNIFTGNVNPLNDKSPTQLNDKDMNRLFEWGLMNISNKGLIFQQDPQLNLETLYIFSHGAD